MKKKIAGCVYQICKAYTSETGAHYYIAYNESSVIDFKSQKFFTVGEIISLPPKNLKKDPMIGDAKFEYFGMGEVNLYELD